MGRVAVYNFLLLSGESGVLGLRFQALPFPVLALFLIEPGVALC
jgi:hypothetical protein